MEFTNTTPTADPAFSKDRSRLFMSEKEYDQYVDSTVKFASISRLIDERNQKEHHQEQLKALPKIQKLTVFQVQEQVREALMHEGFADITYEKARTGLQVVAPFFFQDTRTDRGAAQSKRDAKKAVADSLKPTNWRLAPNGFTYRMGQLEGKIKGYDRDEDLISIVQ